MFENFSTQKRLIVAMVISAIFFVAYDYFFLPKKPIDNNTTTISQNAAPSVENTSEAPQTSQTSPNLQNISQNLVVIKAENFIANIDEFGRISKFELTQEKYKDENNQQISLLNPQNAPLPLEVRFSDTALNQKAFSVKYSTNLSELNLQNEQKDIVLTQNLDEVEIKKIISFKNDGSYDLKVEVSKSVDYFITPGIRPNIQADGYTVHGLMIRKFDDSLEIIEDGDSKGNEVFKDIDLLANSDRYYTTLFYDKNRKMSVYVEKNAKDDVYSFVRSNQNLDIRGYIGPKDFKTISKINSDLSNSDFGFVDRVASWFKDKQEATNPDLTDVIEYGWFTFIAKPVFAFLSFIYSYIGNWGWAIVVMTLVIRIVLYPLTYKGMVSMNKMKDLAPKMKEIQEKYKGDAQKINAHTMDLYRKTGVNPMGGCLPILIQIPIFFAIYRVLLNAIELKGAAWAFWVQDLAVKDPYFILPVLMGIAMFVQQRITPTNFTDPMQEKIMKWLPVIFVFFFLGFPAGLTLYWFINNLCSLVQQYAVNKVFQRQKQNQIAEKQK